MTTRPLKVLIRTAASPEVGAGHVARTSAVARALSDIGAVVRWVCDASTAPYLTARGVDRESVRVLANAATEGCAGEIELPRSQQEADAFHALSGDVSLKPDVVLVDSYLLGATWQRVAKDQGARVAVFDDLVDRPIEADLVVNAVAAPSDYASIAKGAVALCGLAFAVTPAEPAAEPLLEEPVQLLVAFGAADALDATSRTLRALDELGADTLPLRAWIQLGAGARHREAVIALTAKLGWARMLAPAEAIDARLRGIGLCIGGAGVSLFERMRDGIPGIVVPLAPNQRMIAAAAASCGAAVISECPAASAALALELRHARHRLRGMSAAGRAAVDGLGARRIADNISACLR